MKKKKLWPGIPENEENIRRLNWFMEVGFVIESIDFSQWREKITMSGDCKPDDIGTDYTQGGPFRIVFSGVGCFSIRNLRNASENEPLVLQSPRDFTKEKSACGKRLYHLKTSIREDCPGLEILFENVDIYADS